MPKLFMSDIDWIDKFVTIDHVVKKTNGVLFVDTSLGDVEVTLPMPSNVKGRWGYIKKVSTDNNDVILTPPSGLIDTYAEVRFNNSLQSLHLYCDGEDFWII